jgi:hypothetical protein
MRKMFWKNRAVMSTEVPADEGTSTLMGRVGKLCASADPETTEIPKAAMDWIICGRSIVLGLFKSDTVFTEA